MGSSASPWSGRAGRFRYADNACPDLVASRRVDPQPAARRCIRGLELRRQGPLRRIGPTQGRGGTIRPRPDSDFEPFPADIVARAKRLWRAGIDDFAMAHDMDHLRDIERDRELLFNQKDRDPGPANLGISLPPNG